MTGIPAPEGATSGWETVGTTPMAIRGPTIVQFGGPRSVDDRLTTFLFVPEQHYDPETRRLTTYGMLVVDPTDTRTPGREAWRRYFDAGERTLQIGSNPDSALEIADAAVSRVHAQINLDGQTAGYSIRDMGSTRGTRRQPVPEYTVYGSTMDLQEGQWGSMDMTAMQEATIALGSVQGRVYHQDGRMFVSVAGETHELIAGIPVRVGRGRDMNVLVPGTDEYAEVSRNHATLIRVGERVLVRNNSGTNPVAIWKDNRPHSALQQSAAASTPAIKEGDSHTRPEHETRLMREVRSGSYSLPSPNHPCEDLAGGKEIIGADGQLYRRFVVIDGAGGTGRGANPDERSANVREAAKFIHDSVLSARGVDPEAAIRQAKNAMAEFYRRTGNPSAAAIAVVDVGANGFHVASVGDVAVTLWSKDRFNHRRGTNDFPPHRLSQPSNFKLLNTQHNRVQQLADIGNTSSVSTVNLDDHRLANELTSYIDGSGDTIQVFSRFYPKWQYDADMILIGTDGARLAGQLLEPTTPVSEGAKRILANLHRGQFRGGHGMAARALCENSRNVAGDTDDITYTIIDYPK